MSDSEAETDRVTVRTYVPAYQRDEWDDHADRLDMSSSEFVRTMVQAGRRTFGTDGDPFGGLLNGEHRVNGDDDRTDHRGDRTSDDAGAPGDGSVEDTDGPTGESGTRTEDAPVTEGRSESGPGDALETQVVETLSAGTYLSWDELLDAVTDGIEDRLEETLQDLQADNRVVYSGRNGGYTLDE